jgi:phosphinothricin acetyltransferase
VTVTVRAAVPDDLPALTAIYNHYVEHTHITFDLVPYTVEQRRAWFDHYAETGPHRLLVAVDRVGADEVVIGYATSGRFRDKPAYAPSVETSVYCAPDAVGRGAGSALYVALFDALAGEDVHRAFAGVALPNDASLAFHRGFGYTEVGTFREVGRKFGQWWDVQWLERGIDAATVSVAADGR